MAQYENPFSNQEHYHEHTEWIAEHLDDFFDESLVSVFHEIGILDIHLDVYFIKPENASFNILLTSGMSTLKMKVSEHAENSSKLEFAELMMLIPKSINFEDVYSGENKNDWIITILKRTARFPHYYNTWLEIGHSIQAEENLSTYGDDTEFVGALILPSVTFDEKFTQINKDGRRINIYNVFPLYKEELEFKIENGYNKFLDLLIEANGKEMLELNRKNLIPKKSFWNKIFGN
ncbi:Suppressor of fused protein (SUFU) [Tenacibaculum sp. MAR_2009_124]|uniref:suppressor of fused domain protein n=1 Tax=Tenacibaculum sp. MAR_2009_124 TaxID=1250059 RepID=UPI00089BFAED|nr:suppressor of fused domain protein [Tenacibaculum sp. MAR_2009_124]SEB39149.1 Suppressor of fused protein (SUFU) [Tenacibaculum sp. MAR_2009_124]